MSVGEDQLRNNGWWIRRPTNKSRGVEEQLSSTTRLSSSNWREPCFQEQSTWSQRKKPIHRILEGSCPTQAWQNTAWAHKNTDSKQRKKTCTRFESHEFSGFILFVIINKERNRKERKGKERNFSWVSNRSSAWALIGDTVNFYWNYQLTQIKSNAGFLRRGETGLPGENLSVQRREPTNSAHIWLRIWESNPGHIGGRRVLSPLRHPCKKKTTAITGTRQANTQRGKWPWFWMEWTTPKSIFQETGGF